MSSAYSARFGRRVVHRGLGTDLQLETRTRRAGGRIGAVEHAGLPDAARDRVERGRDLEQRSCTDVGSANSWRHIAVARCVDALAACTARNLTGAVPAVGVPAGGVLAGGVDECGGSTFGPLGWGRSIGAPTTVAEHAAQPTMTGAPSMTARR